MAVRPAGTCPAPPRRLLAFPILRLLEQLAGATVMLVVLADLYLTVLYAAAIRRLRDAGIRTVRDEAAGADRYVALRSEWNGQIVNLSRSGAFDMDEIDRAGEDPERSDHRPDFRSRRHALR